MSQLSKISWTHYPWNPWWGCVKCSPECQHCYIPRNLRKHHLDAFATDGPFITQTWNRPYEIYGGLHGNTYARIFTCSHGDFFDRRVDDKVAGYDQKPWRDIAWHIIKNTPNCVYLILTKRPERIADHLPPDWPYANVWLGTSVGCNATLHRVDHLRKIPIHKEAVRFLSCEPLLEDISDGLNLEGIGWLIAGGESGDNPEYKWTPEMGWTPEDFHGRRWMDPVWAYKLMLAARRAAIPFIFKQITATKQGQGADALGLIYHEFPPPPNGGVWMAGNPLKVIQQQGETE